MASARGAMRARSLATSCFSLLSEVRSQLGGTLFAGSFSRHATASASASLPCLLQLRSVSVVPMATHESMTFSSEGIGGMNLLKRQVPALATCQSEAGVPSEMELMAVPKRKVSPSRKGMRRSGKGLKAVPFLVKCKACGRVKMPHFFCCSGTPKVEAAR